MTDVTNDTPPPADPPAIDLADLPDGAQPGKGKIASMPLSTKLCAIWIILLVLAAVFAGLIPGLKDPNYAGFAFGEDVQPNEAPSADYWFGTDNNSRDIFSRIIYGARVSLAVSAAAVTLGTVIGGLLGCLVGFLRGKIEAGVMATIDVILAFPGLVLLLTIVTILDRRDLFVVCVVVGALSIPPYTRVARANALAVSRLEFVTAATALGKKRWRVLVSEVVPNVMPTVLAYALVSAAVVIVLEGALSFLGLSVQLPTASWGNMINQSRNDLTQSYWPALFPSLALVITVFALNNVGDYLRKLTSVRDAAI